MWEKLLIHNLFYLNKILRAKKLTFPISPAAEGMRGGREEEIKEKGTESVFMVACRLSYFPWQVWYKHIRLRSVYFMRNKILSKNVFHSQGSRDFFSLLSTSSVIIGLTFWWFNIPLMPSAWTVFPTSAHLKACAKVLPFGFYLKHIPYEDTKATARWRERN